MNREIKFRAWDQFNQEMLSPDDMLGHKKDLSWFFSQAEQAEKGKNNISIMQYTGLKDKNGVEIYEGDVYSHNNRNYLIVNSLNMGLIAVEINKNIGSILSDFLIKLSHNRRSFYDIYLIQKYIEVIGNLYQNPELLK